MKLQCTCGAKYAFDTTPEMVQNPVKFVCPKCGQDSSAFVNELIRRQYGAPAPVTAFPPEPTPPPALAASPAPAEGRLKLAREDMPEAPAQPVAPVSKYCSRHRSELTTEKCVLCHKPICPKCLVEFGYFCSPLCKGKAEAQHINVPVYANQKFEAERRFWRKTGWIFGTSAAAIVIFFGAWTWYAWYGSVPHAYFSVRFEDDRAHSGRSQLVGKDQIVFLHGGLLARYDLKTKKQIWSQQLVTPEQVAAEVKREDDESARERARENANSDGDYGRVITPDEHAKMVRDELEAGLALRVSGQNVWIGKSVESTNAAGEVSSDYQLTRYDWDSGRIVQQATIPATDGDFVQRGDELLLYDQPDPGTESITHVSLADGAIHEEQITTSGYTNLVIPGGGAGPTGDRGGGLFAQGARPLDPNKVTAQAQNLNLPARIALPALLANQSHEQQLEAALRGDSPRRRAAVVSDQKPGESFQLVPIENGYLQMTTRLLEEKSVTRSAMKAPPKKSVLNDPGLNASQTADVANEMLNEGQRNSGGGDVTEDVSRYQVSLRRTSSTSVDWTGEVVGPPQIFSLKTVNVLTANKTVIVFDKTNKKLWEATLTYDVPAGYSDPAGATPEFGQIPCAEYGNTLYVCDQAVLSAFDLATGNARWRLPSVGIVGLFFDDQGMVYVNTTSGSLDDIKYSRQIDIAKSTDDILLKVEPQTGKTLWSIKPGGFISYVSGKFIYAIQSNDPNPDDEDQSSNPMADLQKPAYMRIIRISPKDGHTLWDFEEDRCPIDTQFTNNSIQLVFKREVQVLRYLSF
jgi:hypothetical protein